MVRRHIIFLGEDVVEVIRRRVHIEQIGNQGRQGAFVEGILTTHRTFFDEAQRHRFVFLSEFRFARVSVWRPGGVTLGRGPVRNAGRQVDVRAAIHQPAGYVFSLLQVVPHFLYIVLHTRQEIVDDHLCEVFRKVVQEHLPVFQGNKRRKRDPVALAVFMTWYNLRPASRLVVVCFESELLVGAATASHRVHDLFYLAGMCFKSGPVLSSECFSRTSQTIIEDTGQIGPAQVDQVETIHGRIFELIMGREQDFEYLKQRRKKTHEAFDRA